MRNLRLISGVYYHNILNRKVAMKQRRINLATLCLGGKKRHTMAILFYIASLVAILATLLVITRKHPVHALLYLVVSFLSVSIIFYQLGAPFIAVLEIIVYAGAIVVFFIFVVMMLNLGIETKMKESEWLRPQTWFGPTVLSGILLIELIYMVGIAKNEVLAITEIGPTQVAASLFGPYLIGVELAAMLLMAGVVGAAHIGQHKRKHWHRFLKE